ncbi:MAG: hypothetical protein ACR2MD_18460 [Aridibacter sp.]
MLRKNQLNTTSDNKNNNQRGAALAIVIIIVAILAVIAMTALAFSSSEARIAGSDLQRSQTFYAAVAGIEKMTNDFSNLFLEKIIPTTNDLNTIAGNHPTELKNEGFSFSQTLVEDTKRLNELRGIQGLSADTYPRVNIPEGPYAGLYASVVPYKLSSTALMNNTGVEVEIEREFNNYLVPIFQFGMFSNEDIEIHPGPQMTFNGRVHTNKNLYALRNVKFLNRLTIAGEFVRDAWRSGEINTRSGNQNIYVQVNGINVQSTLGNGSVKPGSGYVGGPNLPASTSGSRGYFPGSPNGVANSIWETNSIKPAASNTPNRFGGQLLTNTTGATQLKLPLELSGNSPAEIIKRTLPTDDYWLSTSRYHAKAQVRILIDDRNAGSGSTNVAGIPATKGVLLRNNPTGFTPIPLGGGNALRRVSDAGSYIDSATIKQREPSGTISDAKVVRGIKNSGETSSLNYIPAGSGIEAKILIEVVKSDGTAIDVTQEILSMGMTVGEPNGIVYLQRPIWAAFIQGNRDRAGNSFNLVNLTKNYQHFADGEIIALPTFETDTGYISMTPGIANEDSGTTIREVSATGYNSIYPINIYNVREGWYQSSMNENDIYERGITSVIDINMRNLARWLDGVYDTNLLAGTNAESKNIKGDEGYVVYISDRRSDRKNTEYLSNGSSYTSTNGIVDNEDIYGPNNILDEGEDVIDFGWTSSAVSKKGTLQRDLNELPTTGKVFSLSSYPNRLARAMAIMQYPVGYFRRSIRLFNGEDLMTSTAAKKLSKTKGITIASENMVYIWGNYNTTGVSSIPVGGSTLNDGGYMGNQVPASIVGDAFFPLSKTWFDGLTAMRPEGSSDPRNTTGTAYRMADADVTSVSDGTAVRAGIIAGTTISSLTASPGRDSVGLRLNGGIINYPRFLELWNLNGTTKTWSYTGSFIPLYRSTQAVAQWENVTSVIYMPPQRNWSFDTTFLTPNKLPPGTPFFQYVQATAFRQKLR